MINWPTVFLALGPAIITGIFTALGSWLLYRYQLRTKTQELRGQTELRARELFFEAYQRGIDNSTRQTEAIAKVLGQMTALLHEDRDDEEKQQQALCALVLMMTVSVQPLLDWLSELESEVQQLGLTERKQRDLSRIRKILSTNLDGININEVGPLYVEFMTAISLIYSLNNAILAKKCEDLFSEYLPQQKALID
ncbi:MAG: hypothetical protein AABO41_08755 [Acidobacteriota bacterium]